MPTKPLAELKVQVGETRITVNGFHVERGKIAEFADAIHATNPVHYNPDVAREQGYSDVVAPITFGRVAYFQHNRPDNIDRELGFDLGFVADRVIHGEQRFEYVRPLVAGDVLDGQTTLVEIYQRESDRAGILTFATYETEFFERDDGHVLTTLNTRIETGQAIEADND